MDGFRSNEDENKRGQDGANSAAGFGWRYYVWLFVFLLIVLWWAGTAGGERSRELSYTEFRQEVSQGNVASVTIEGQRMSGEFKRRQPAEGEEQQQAAAPPSRFTTVRPPMDDSRLMELLDRNGVAVRAEPTEGPWWATALIGILPWILIIGLIFYASRKMQQRMSGGGDGMFGFGKSKAKRFREGMTNVTFNDVAGAENAKRDLQEVIGYLRDTRRYQSIGAKVPRGILLMGPPGTGKTLLAKAVAGEAHVPFYSISASEFIEMFVGVGAARVRDMFQAAKKEAPSIVFIDELDSVGRSRGTGVGGGHDEREQTLNQILNEMDGFEPHETVIVLAATNRPDVLDPALLRPGRFDRKVTIDLPRREARKQILEVHTRKVPLADDVELGVIADRTVGFSGADLENLVNEAALLSGREQRDQVHMDAFDMARDKIILGDRREDMLTDEERKVVAYHESGHALLAWVLPEADPLDKVSIIPRGRALGATEQKPEEERHNIRRGYLLDRLAVMLGGRAAEKVVFGDVTTGAESDLKQASNLARKMISQWGMSEKLGAVAYREGEEHVFLGREMSQPREFSERTAQIIDEEVFKLISGTEERALQTLREHRTELDALGEALLESETLDSAQIQAMFDRMEKAGKGKLGWVEKARRAAQSG